MSKSFQYPNNPIIWSASPHDFSGDNLMGPYAVETTQRYIFGTRLLTWDGRVYKYSHATSECQSGYGAWNYAPVNISVVLPAAPATTAAGDRQLSVTIASGDGYAADGVIAKDELAGGFVVVGNGTEDPDNRMIVGNTAVASGGGTTILDLEYPLVGAWTASSSYSEVLLNPYAHLVGGITTASSYSSVMGIPVRNLVATYNGFIQTWGPTWITPGGGDAPGDAAGEREVFFVGDGSINGGGAAITTETGYQRAGFIIQRDAASTGGPPFVMLQISI